MYKITIDLDIQKVGYKCDGNNIIIRENTYFVNYIFIQHLISYFKFNVNIIFNIKFNHNIITVDSSIFSSGNYKVTSVDLYYKDKNNDPLIICIVFQPELGHRMISSQHKHYYKFRELNAYGNGSTVKLTSLTKINQLDKKILDQEYKEVNINIKIEMDYGKGNYMAEIEKCMSDIGDGRVDVNVSGPDQLIGVDFVKYKYTFTGDGFNKLEFNSTDVYLLTEFNGSDFNDINLDSIIVYYYIQDNQRILPLVIEFRPKSGKQFRDQKKEKSVFYKLNIIISDEDDNDLNKRKCFYYIDKSESYIKNKLQSIYKDQNIRLNIEKLIGLKKDTMTEYIILGVILLIYIPVAVLSYIYYNKIMSALRSVYNKFSNCITKS